MQLWSQLCLDASLTINDSNRLLISLSVRSSSTAVTRPPSCVQSVCLTDIRMTLQFSNCRRTKTHLRAQVAVSGSGGLHDLVFTHPADEYPGRRHYSHLSSREGSQGVPDNLAETCDLRSLRTSSVGISPESSQDSVSSNTHWMHPLDNPTTCRSYTVQQVELETLVQLVDASLRRMLSDYQPVRSGGIVLSSDDGFLKLAAISPPLFSPGYAKAVSQRFGLLPTISRTVSRINSRTNSSRLREKLHRLQLSPRSYLLTRDRDSTGNTISSFVEARLWFLIQSKLIDPRACRSLKSLRKSNQTGLGSHSVPDEPLEDAGDIMLDGDGDEAEAPMFDAYGESMELDGANDLDLFEEHSLVGIADERIEPLDDDFLSGHAEGQIV
ncbi:hypothetical protein BDR22DRAFT_56501 [Usnea florida]